MDLTRPPEEVPDDNAPKVHPVDLQVIRAKLPDNLYWRMGAPTQDPAELERREAESRRWNELYGKVLSADATVEQIREYYGHRRQVSEDFITFSTEVLSRFGDVLPERDRGLYELSINMHRTRLAELPAQEQDALDRREAQERRREAGARASSRPERAPGRAAETVHLRTVPPRARPARLGVGKGVPPERRECRLPCRFPARGSGVGAAEMLSGRYIALARSHTDRVDSLSTGQDPGGASHGGSDASGLDTALLDQMPEAVVVCSLDAVCLHVNPSLERHLGRPRQELLGRRLWELHPEWTERSFQERFLQVARTGESAEFECHAEPQDRWFVKRLFRVHERVVLFSRDISAEKKQEATLRALYDEMRRAQRHAAFLAQASEVLASSLEHDLILQRMAHLAVPILGDACSVDLPMPDGQVRRAAAAFSKPEMVGPAQDFQARYPIRLEDAAGIGKVLRTGVTEFTPDFPAMLAAAQGGSSAYRRAVEALGISAYIIVPLISRGRVLGALTLLNSESRRRYTEADVRLAEDLARRAATSLDNGRLYTEAQEAVRARDSFLSVASHELNTPLTSLMLNIQALRRDMEPRASNGPASPEALSTKVVAVQRQVSRLSSLVRELLDVSRITAGRLRLEREDLDLAALTREVVPRFTEDLARAGCALHLDAGAPPPAIGTGCGWSRCCRTCSPTPSSTAGAAPLKCGWGRMRRAPGCR
ncbi:PAS domain-containing sensor histidine kinase [Myxococcus sp. MxC21-1]|uniref:PAS domain-containing sensor histidine kinase n=1 Tax=Myxococcus sp. MxC21-1 TaxID=3041439 RepID=UPI00292E8409|nr:PAS domain-containing sensor histidine kinase [Myxococcus sp. MxC21-1]WNZ60230.1 PAS domain-containing sensor histidine kinase [Myxococcus sp. MxC21-1]